MNVSATDLDIMARTLFGEARGEPTEGKIAVAWVIRNRLSRPKRFGSTIGAVCRQPYQFSCWNSHDPNLPKLKAVTLADPVFKECLQIATDVCADKIPDPTNGAQFYRAIGTPADWAIDHKPCAEIGAHEFFNDVN